jgi:hypothetical protein
MRNIREDAALECSSSVEYTIAQLFGMEPAPLMINPKEVPFLTMEALAAGLALSSGIRKLRSLVNGKNQLPQGPVQQHDIQ